MKLNFVTPSLALIIVAMGFFIAWQCESGKRKYAELSQGDKLHQEQIHKLEATAQTAGARIVELVSERGKLLDSVLVAVASKKGQIKKHEQTTERLRPEVAARLDSVPVLKVFIASLDSTIKEQKELIQGLELSHAAEIVNLEEQLKQSGIQRMAEVEQKEAWRISAESAQKDVRKEQRRKGFWKVTSAVLAASVVYISLKE